ncbi:hypothetical protein MLD38_017659 [Melastoma candidum]|uniref:Uncharacterized protein n=1 Tax=Melastoma candidum TaxID=119954 RepID=A0ACB9QSN2_9MYRT|nr:hypothetical protein MLD38_017659 [Melastoma candidum]
MEDHSSSSSASTSSPPDRFHHNLPRDPDEPTTAASSSSSSYAPPSLALHEDHTVHGHDLFLHHEIDDQQQRHPLFEFNFRRNNFISFEDASSAVRDDTWSCIVVVLTFWFFVSMTLILGVYGSVTLRLSPNSSILVEPNSIFVQSLKVEELDDTRPHPALYGFSKSPQLDVIRFWKRSHNASVSIDSHKEWIYYLNEGSLINISYSVKSPGSSIYLVLAQGTEGFSQWLEDPTYPNITLSWNLVNGDGMIQQVIYKSSSYYIAVGNLNYEEVSVELDLSVKAYLYNTTKAYYKCTFLRSECSFTIRYLSGDSAVLATTAPGLSTPSDEWYIKISYGPRWITYLVGAGGMTVLMLLAFNFLNKFRCGREDNLEMPHIRMEPERAPLLMPKDEDLSSWGSFHDSSSQDEEDIEEMLAAQAPEGKLLKDGENSNNTRRLCGICFDAPRDCFFLPCGHCVACLECGLRIVEASGTCPVCRRNMKKVRRIFTV